ncbi:MAG: hypothetical protein L0Y66_18100 [Myxococcaceae bacterium]|nr:hypothetical protein [Myxococcaceae bacterium]MCI0673059.1 hypothetical protein [Myxococcaceae bacterium]
MATERAERKNLIKLGAIGGLIAGAIFALAEMLAGAAFFKAPLLAPWQAFSSTVLGQSALEGGLTFGKFLTGVVSHFTLSAIYGAAFGAIVSLCSPKSRTSYGTQSAAGMLFGLGLYLLNFQVIARLIYPWFRGVNQPAQVLYHVLAFGLPLALYVASKLRRPVARVGAPRRVTA